MIDLTSPRRSEVAFQSLLQTYVAPSAPNITDGVPYEMGVELTFAKIGYIKAIRYYKSPSETGTHTGRIWSSTGALLTSVDFVLETSEGWQQQNLASPFLVDAAKYVISVNTNSHFAITASGFSSSFVNGDISAIADGANGVYATTIGEFPSLGGNSNYFRDVIFVARS